MHIISKKNAAAKEVSLGEWHAVRAFNKPGHGQLPAHLLTDPSGRTLTLMVVSNPKRLPQPNLCTLRFLLMHLNKVQSDWTAKFLQGVQNVI